MSAKFSVALSAPPVEGLKVSVTVQVPPPEATGVPDIQVAAVIAKSAAFVPEMPGLLLKLRAPLPVFVRVTVIVGLVVPSVIEPKGWLPGRTTTGSPEGVPVPVRETLCVLGVALSVKLRDANSAEVVEGLNVSVTVQLPPAATGDPVTHVAPVMTKSAAFAPETLGLLVKFRGAAPVFISVTVIGPVVTPCMAGPKGRLPGRVTLGAVPVPVSETA